MMAGGNRVTDAATGQGAAEARAVVAFVGGQAERARAGPAPAARHADRGQRGWGGRDIRHRAAVQMQTNGQSMTLDDDVPLGGYPRPGAAGFVAPFFAFTYEPSRAQCRQSSFPAASRSRNKCRHSRNSVPSLFHAFSRRHAVE